MIEKKDLDNIINGLFHQEIIKKEVEVISTGSLALDLATGLGGIPRGSIVEICGGKSTGKSTLVLSMIAEIQKLYEIPVIMNTDQDLDIKYADSLGVDPTKVLAAQPDTLTEMMEMVLKLASITGEERIGAIFVDTITGVLYSERQTSPQLQEQALRQFLTRLLHIISKTGTIVVFTSQYRLMQRNYRKVTGTSGGKPIVELAHIRIHLEKNGNIRDLYDIIGYGVDAEILKNTRHSKLNNTNFNILYKSGIDKLSEVVDLGVKHKIIQKQGSWYSHKNHKEQGIEDFKAYFRENPKIIEEIEQYLLLTVVKPHLT